MKLGRLNVTLLTAALALGAVACGSDDGSDDAGPAAAGSGGSGGSGGAAQTEHMVELFSWWTAPGEAEALQALINVHKVAHPEARIYNAAAESGTDAQNVLAERMVAGDPPDVFQENAHDIRAFLAENPGKLEPLNALFTEWGLEQAILPEVLADVTVDGSIYSAPVNLHRENSLFYNKDIFAEHNLTPPKTLAELMTACATLKAAGVTPMATAYQGWILRIMFNSIAIGTLGAAEYKDYITGKTPRDDAKFRQAIETFETILDEYSNADANTEEFGWTNAAKAVYNGEAAMFIHGDWAKGYFVQLGWSPGVDFGVVAAGSPDMFLYGVDVFALPTGGPNPVDAKNFLHTVGSKEGQVAFNRLKGSSPIRLDVPKDQLDELGRETLAELETADVRLRVRGKNAWDEGLLAFAQTRDIDALMQVYTDNPPDN